MVFPYVAPVTPVSVILIVPDEKVIPVPPVKCKYTSDALGPVYVNTPDTLLYANDPSPPVSVTLIDALALASVKYLFDPSTRSSVFADAILVSHLAVV